MSVFKIAWRSIQHRGLGSLLTILSMALGVMLVVSVLSIHGLISESFRNNSSFGYNILVGARGGGLQLTMNTVYYLQKPVENIPYEYYLAFCDQETRTKELENSICFHSFYNEQETLDLAAMNAPGMMGLTTSVGHRINELTLIQRQITQTGIDRDGGKYKPYADMAIPMCMGDTYEIEDSETYFRCVGTKPQFFDELVLDLDTEQKFEFAKGRKFKEWSPEHGYHECVIGALVAKRAGLDIGSVIQPTHGDPNDSNAKKHKQGFTVVGILKGTRTPHDRVLFLNMEGFYLMDEHSKPIDEESLLGTDDDGEVDEWDAADQWDDEDEPEESQGPEANKKDDGANVLQKSELNLVSFKQESLESDNGSSESQPLDDSPETPLPIEQREVTSILVLTADGDPVLAYFLPAQINEGDIESTLKWSSFRPSRSQKAVQAVNPVEEISAFFATLVDPIQWMLLALTIMICVVSAISILVGIYNSMSQRSHEIAVMRALGANRSKVMTIMLLEAFLLASLGGLLGWIGGHALNVAISPFVEMKTGVGVGFFDLAPGIPVFGYLGDNLPAWLVNLKISPELLLIPGLILLSMIVGIYPAITAYRTDVAKSLGK